MAQRGLSFGLAAFLWVACAFELFMLALRAIRGTLADSGFLGRLLAQPDLADRVAPLAVVLVFTWILLQVLVRAVRIAREQAAVPAFRSWSGEALRRIPERLRAGRRARMVLQHYPGSPGKLAEALPAVGALDAVAVENNYSILKACVWTLPVFGFIGTAWGMSHAIRGFSEALKATAGQQAQIELLTDRLGQLVIPGLANAFAITMVALGASVIAHFWTTTLQAWDQDVLCDLDQTCVEKLAEISPANGALGIPRELLAVLNERLAQLTQQLAALNGKLDLVDAADYLKQSAAEHVSAAQEVRRAASELQNSVRAPYHITISREQVQ
jgi:biopolymer transport protein ExbB/TolQ